MGAIERVTAYIDEHWPAHLAATRAFVRQPSISGDGAGMAEMAALVRDKIVALGGAAEIVPTPLYPVVWGHIDAGKPHTLLYYGMYDVQPVLGEEAAWIAPPFGGEIRDLPGFGECVVNRGITNQKGPLIGFFNVLEAIEAVAGELPLNITFMIEGEEELGSRNLPGFVRENRDRLRADAAFFSMYNQAPDGKVVSYLGVKGILFCELIARGGDWGGPAGGRAVHGSNAVWFGSPAWRLVHALATMITPDQKHILIDGFYDDVATISPHDEALLARLAPTLDPAEQLRANDVRRFKYDLAGADLLKKYLYQPTLNIDGLISGHTAEGTKTIIPHEARAKVDIRMVPNQDPERMLGLVRDHLARHGYGDIEIRLEDAYKWAKTTVDTPAIKALVRTYADFGIAPELWPHLGGSAPFYLFTDVLGIPFALGGLGHGGRVHSPNEYATVDGMLRHEQSVATYLYRLAEELAAG
ncbi:MAG TPA: M20/M25/M40 family metallo-hydrolase [Thermomicrobiales bacterium]|nr:M20/M25/M40 family metallo-hydrolase [Thermomicrobiales bacterium]